LKVISHMKKREPTGDSASIRDHGRKGVEYYAKAKVKPARVSRANGGQVMKLDEMKQTNRSMKTAMTGCHRRETR